MALRVWLPLNGNLENKGLSNPTLINMGATISNTGKIGQCYSFNGSNNIIYTTNFSIGSNFTLSFWFNPTDFSSNTRWLLCLNSSGGTGDTQGGIYLSSQSIVYVAGGTTSTYNANLIANTWYHVTVTFDGTNAIGYLNGSPVVNFSGSSLSKTNLTIGARSNNSGGAGTAALYFFKGLMNDLRIYDECLSPKQIKEISKGLVAHYKLEGLGANSNLLKGTNLGTNGWTYNVGSRYGKTMEEVEWQGVRACKFGITDGDTSSTSNWRVVEFRTQSFSNVVLKPSTNYVISFDTDRRVINSCSFRAGNAQHPLGDAASFPSTVMSDGSYHYKIQITTVASDNESWTYDDQYLYMQYLVPVDDFGIIANLKLEEGTVETKWVPHKEDTLYTNLGYNNILITDVSGNGYNLTSVGTFDFSGDSPRYDGTEVFTSNSTYLELPILDTSGFANSFTIICWSKKPDISSKMMWGFQDGNKLNIFPTGTKICCNTGDSANNPYQNDSGTAIDFTQWNNGDWHQYVMVGDGTTNKLYVDGEYQGKAKTYKGITGTQMYISGWDTGTNYKWTDGSISDFRIYSTALSADDIKQLYQTAAFIDNKNKVYAYEFKEE